MPYKDRTKQSEYQAAFLRRRRDAWLAANGPCARCSSWEELEVDHVDPAQKVTHNVWSWSAKRRAAELAKCQVLCSKCHKAKTKVDKGVMFPVQHGTDSAYTQRGCRCSECREAHRAVKSAWRDRARAAGRRAT